MPSPLPRPLRRSASDLPFFVFLVTVALCLLRARDLPEPRARRGRDGALVGPADVALLATAVLAACGCARGGRFPRRALLAAAAGVRAR